MIRNKINNKCYIGLTSENFRRRFWLHKWKLKTNCHDNSYLQRSYNKYGFDNFEYLILYVYNEDDAKSLNDLEIEYISQYDTYKNGYNMTIGGEGTKGHKMSEEHKRNIGEKNRINMLGKKHSEETKLKMSEAAKGHIKSKEHCENLSKSLTGVIRSDNTKQKLREIFQGSKSAKAKLNEEQVREIKKLTKDKILTHQEIADKFNVKRPTIRSILHGHSWKHVS